MPPTHTSEVAGRALDEAAARVQAIRDLAGSEFGRHLPPDVFARGVRGLAEYAAMFLAIAQEHGEAA